VSDTARRVFICDDDDDNAESLRMLFVLDGFEAHVCTDASAVVPVARALRPHLVVIDLVWAGSPAGPALIRRLRAAPETRATMIVALSGRSDPAMRAAAIAAGADDFIVKPGDPMRLIDHASRIDRRTRSAPPPGGERRSGGERDPRFVRSRFAEAPPAEPTVPVEPTVPSP